jgi:hypothetical protein
MFLKEKRNGDIKGRACADGRKQWKTINKEDAASPTVATESVFTTAAIEAHEGRRVAVFDIPGAYLHTKTDEDVIMVLEGPLAELMVKVAPSLYRKYITTNSKGKALLYDGLLRSVLLFYKKLVKDLEDYGFEINPYDPCVANMMIDGKQMTVIWHVDDLKVSHVDAFELTKFASYLSSIYGGLAVHQGKKHDYLGMDLDYSEQGKVGVSMIPYLNTVLRNFPEHLGATATSPAAEHLFKVCYESEARFLPEEQAQDFHHVVAQLLFLSSRARRDIQTAVAFLCTRVKRPDEDDWGKLKRVLKYLKGTRGLKLTLSVDNLSIIQWWVDASYVVHEDCRGHTGAMMSLGKGAVTSFSTKQKINGKSSTEDELIGVDDAMPRILWTKYLIETQGYTVEHNKLYQDSKSAILLEKNGKFSSSKRTKRIKTRYFFVTDKVAQGDLEIEHQGAEEMWADILTKPLQGKAFREFWAKLMNCAVNYQEDDSVSEEVDKIAGVSKPSTYVGNRAGAIKSSYPTVNNPATKQ